VSRLNPSSPGTEPGDGAADFPEAPSTAAGTEAPQPGLRELREAVANTRPQALPHGPSLRHDAVAGLSLVVANVPDGMANGVLVGVNPLYGLYATMMGPLVGGFLSSTRLMVITTTAAASLTAGQSLSAMAASERANALFLLVLLVGVFQIVCGMLGLGRLTRFVSYSVTTGFLAGISTLLIVSQVPTLAGYAATGSNRVMQAIDVLTHVNEINLAALGTGLLALVLAVLLPRTRMKSFGRLLAVVVPSLLIALVGADVKIVSDVGEIARSIPTPHIPTFALVELLNVVTGALSVTIVTLVQGVGVAQSVPNRDGSRTRVSRDFIAQGAANVACGLFRGLPVGGSLSATAINVISGGATRWASISAGVGMAVIVVGVPGLVGFIAMPALGALLMVAGASSLKPSEVTVLRTAGWPSLLAGATTYLATLFLPIQAAVGFGVVLSALLFLGRTASAVELVHLVRHPDGRIEERAAPRRLQGGAITVLDVYGDLFYAGARTFERLLPAAARGTDHPVVVVRLRGRLALGATLIDVLGRYAEQLADVNGRLYLTGVSDAAHQQIVHSDKLHLRGTVRAQRATAFVWESTSAAVADANAWLASEGVDRVPTDPSPAAEEPRRRGRRSLWTRLSFFGSLFVRRS
jgi:SulP family sulfate permease